METETKNDLNNGEIEKISIEIEAILFWKGEPMSVKKIAASLGKKEEEISSALEVLKGKIAGRGVELLFKDGEVMLGTAPSLSHLIERLTKEELVRDLGKAGLETISIIAYKGPISRADIDYIRGVQSNFILRNLQIRGLVEKITNPADHRSFLYRPTFELLQFLGVSKIEDLPEYEKVRAEFNAYQAENSALDNMPKETGEVSEPSTISSITEESETFTDEENSDILETEDRVIEQTENI
ncbi:MAG: SMC-Scp complex subunit ScpB [bacterium]